MPAKKLPPEVLEFFRRQGSKGGKKSAAALTPDERKARSRKAHEAMTPEQRSERARIAVAVREAMRKARKKARI